MKNNGRTALSIALTVTLCVFTAAQSGCIGFTSHLLYWAKGGHKIEAEYPGLKDKRVAIVCAASSTASGPNTVPDLVQRSVGTILEQKGSKITVIHPDEIADWIDTNDWDQVDYQEIGQGVNADAVLAIELAGFRLHEGRTLYKGQADVTITVFDMNNEGKIAFRRVVPDFSFPRNGARHSTEISEAKFRVLFVQVLAQQIAKYFYEYNLETDFANDVASLRG